MGHYVSKAMPIHLINSNDDYNYFGLICNSTVCCGIRITNAHNAGMKSVIVLGCASHYYNFLTCVTHTINSKYHSQPYYYIYMHIPIGCRALYMESTDIDLTLMRYVMKRKRSGLMMKKRASCHPWRRM